MVAKSYQSLEIVGEVFTNGGKQYVNVRTAAGALKQVRWYEEGEYNKYYGNSYKKPAAQSKTQKETLGFGNGYITIFKGDTYACQEWFRLSKARYHKIFGWYIVSTEEMPENIPEEVEPVRLNWEEISANDSLKSDSEVRAFVEGILYERGESRFQGEIGGKISGLEMTCIRAFPVDGMYGTSTIHTFKDDNGNLYLWSTAARVLEEGVRYQVSGGIKDHKIYRNQEETVLTRCRVKEA